MSEAGHDGLRVLRGEVYQGSLQRSNEQHEFIYSVAQIQTHVGCHLVIA